MLSDSQRADVISENQCDRISESLEECQHSSALWSNKRLRWTGRAAGLHRLRHARPTFKDEHLYMIFKPECGCIDAMCIRAQRSQ